VSEGRLEALGAIFLWGLLAALAVRLATLPAFLLTGVALLVGSLVGVRSLLSRPPPLRALALGVYGLFGFHFFLFLALRHAPPVEANLVNYLWPLLIVVLAPLLLTGMQLRPLHVVAALLGFAGAAVAILGARSGVDMVQGERWGFIPAAGSALIWATYSLGTRRVAWFPTSAVGLFGLVSGALSLVCHVLLEPSTRLSVRDWGLVVLCGLGPLGGAFYLWDMALKRGDARQIGILSYLTPMASTALLLVVTGRALSPSIAWAAGMIIVAAVLGARAR
jgi:drug/metabolite transporter (DMT)-like permease